ncbi:MAG TPA: hypothetical protein VMZ29_11755 [Candidatus Bathyarchaeia archaeon]|nr:hypothetical protein [Candidatus Bathyarchaeia archaeon]
MTDEKLSEKEFHEKIAMQAFNHTWDLLDKQNRTLEENLEMIHSAHASRFHWEKIGKPLQFERGEWQISRVYSVLKKSDSALLHAQRCLDICLTNKIGDFDLAFAYEARAYSVAGNKNEKDKFLKLAKKAGEKIVEDDDKKYFFSELENLV